jgi:hypothetical protein
VLGQAGWKKTNTASPGLSPQLQEIKHTLVCALDQTVAGLGLADGLGHPCALYQTGP